MDTPTTSPNHPARLPRTLLEAVRHFADADVFVHPRTGWLALRRGSHWTTYVAVSIGCCTDAGSESRRNGQATVQRNSESER